MFPWIWRCCLWKRYSIPLFFTFFVFVIIIHIIILLFLLLLLFLILIYLLVSCNLGCNGHGKCMSISKIYDFYTPGATIGDYDQWDALISTCVCDPGKLFPFLFCSFVCWIVYFILIINYLYCHFILGYTGANCQLSKLNYLINYLLTIYIY